MLRCPKCQYKNPDDARICNLCSNKIDPSMIAASGGATPGTTKRAATPPDQFMFEPRMLGGGINRRATGSMGAPPAATTERHFLVPPTGEPARIEAGTTYLIGREDNAQIRILAPRVSRKHAEIKFDGQKPAVHDMGSQNGTIVNGLKLESKANRPLQDGDVVDIGGVTMIYRLLKPGEPESKLKVGGTESTLVAAGPEEEADLTGNVALMPIPDVLRRLETLKATGLLVIEAGGAKGALRIEDGAPVAGSYAGLENAAAIAAVRSLAQGKFRFEMEDPEKPLAEVVVPEPPKKTPATARQAAPPPPAAKPAGPPPTGKPGAPPPKPGQPPKK